ncbi:MAG: hypothetical protein HYV16_05600 [Gammaproteobacteria bacterium]|nr:hypothetical protein [Gammaproteobacteria bacterium]
MSYDHNAEADFAASEVARMLVADPGLCYEVATRPSTISASASYEPSSAGWPKADGLISILEGGTATQRDIALEYKRPQEGIHGLLTAIGQAHGYLHKGYSGAAIVIPVRYTSHVSPAEYVRDVLDEISESRSIGVFSYETPDTTSAIPFAGRIKCVRPFIFAPGRVGHRPTSHGPKTQWVHMREGSTTRDAFFRFLQVAKRLSADPTAEPPTLRPEIVAAIGRLAPGKDPVEYITNTADNRFLTRVWQYFWLEWLATPTVLTPWRLEAGVYSPPGAKTRILRDDGAGFSQLWEGRANGLKETLSAMLNRKEIDEPRGWELFIGGIQAIGEGQNKQGVRDRAHSYREDIDSALAQLQWLEYDGIPTDHGYRYMTICERYGGANSQAAIDYMGATLIQTGRYASFLHYIHRLSERTFAEDPLAYTRAGPDGKPVFTEDSYWEYLQDLETKLVDELRVLRKVSGRARPRVRTTFQVELTLLRNYGFVSTARHRLGVGVPIDWEQVVQALNVEL